MQLPDVTWSVNVPQLTALLTVGVKLVSSSWRNHSVLTDLRARLERVEALVLNGGHRPQGAGRVRS